MTTLNESVRFHLNNILPLVGNLDGMKSYLVDQEIPFPKAKNDEGFKARLLCPKWWGRTIDKLVNRDTEADLIEQGRISKHKEKYSSNLTVHRVGKKAAETKEYMEAQSMIADSGEHFEMSEILDHSIANPNNRRAELMIRMSGFEIYAQEHGQVGEFYTLTCPSKYHRFSGNTLNEKYELTPKDAQNYLVALWANIRAVFAKHDIKPYGFRVAEPHHDGCPHWHMLLFVKPEQRQAMRDIMSHYALLEDGEESGASEHRFKYVEIDSLIGTATGYIAKYISKNLGFSIDDMENDVNDSSKAYGQRVKAWASVWGIRQFQQIGGAPVTVWRELRKIREPLQDELLESARIAADQSRWSDFLIIMGGVDVKRIDMQIILLKKNMIDTETGELKQNQYKEYIVLIYGLATLASQAITRIKTWSMISTKELNSILEVEGLNGVARRAVSSPWSSVNNCNP